MKTYVVNLARSIDRRVYMENLLKTYSNLDVEFIDAVDGRIMSEGECNESFDIKRFAKEMLKEVRPGEIGCTLSHQKCYKKIVSDGEQSAVIFEDDLIFNEDITLLIPKIEDWLDCDEPRVLLLSGWFWHTSSHLFDKKHKISKVIDGYLTHGYALNRNAAKLMIDNKPWYVADSWNMFAKRGIKIYGLKPHPCDQDWSGIFTTVVNDENQRNVNFLDVKNWIKIKKRSAMQKLLKSLGKFEKPER
jgi:glycoside transferase family 25